MARLASFADFEDNGSGLGTLYDHYSRFPFFAARVNDLKQRFAPAGQKLLIAGCGWGYLVEECLTAGYDAWGCDASAYAVARAQEMLTPAARVRVVQGDALSASSMLAVCSAAGIGGGNPRFELLATEDLLSCLTDGEVTTALSVLRARCRTNLLHLVTCVRLDWWQGADDAERRAKDLATRNPVLNWKTLAGWQAICSPPDVVMDTQSIGTG